MKKEAEEKRKNYPRRRPFLAAEGFVRGGEDSAHRKKRRPPMR